MEKGKNDRRCGFGEERFGEERCGFDFDVPIDECGAKNRVSFLDSFHLKKFPFVQFPFEEISRNLIQFGLCDGFLLGLLNFFWLL
jgi:hypothetical protein